MITAAWWRPLDNGQVACDLCPIACRLREGQTGPCATRANHEGTMVPLHYGRIVSSAIDPIEKKPLYHFHPGSPILSVAAPGCNLHCMFCQNWNISQNGEARTLKTSPTDLVAMAQAEESVGIAFTYSEPLVWYEFVKDTAGIVREKGLKNVLVTNGYLNPEPLAELLPLIDAANIDLKSMDDVFYRKICKARLEPVLASIRQFREAGVHLEITNLLIPGHNDRDDQITALVDFVAGLDQDIPLHFSAYHPAWKLNAQPTPPATLQRARELAAGKLKYVYLGNTNSSEGRDTVCPDCGTVVVERSGYRGVGKLTDGDRCPGCGARIPVVVN
ncbi:MAG: AmmeMemoRadiSam system radical SAM enzyme [Candidatus Krumholzibacteria bacterium]|nr:AmmeMemoRadiSam system radical SAM enzyme [Candidatus Krumholzibacteria bacterium]